MLMRVDVAARRRRERVVGPGLGAFLISVIAALFLLFLILVTFTHPPSVETFASAVEGGL